MRRLILVAVAAPLLGACVSSNKRAVTADGQIRDFTQEQLDRQPPCPWRACILDNPGLISNTVADGFRRAFLSVVVTPDMGAGRSCDVGFRFQNIWNGDSSDAISAYSGEALFHLDANYLMAAKVACVMLQSSEPFGAKLTAQQAAAGLPPIAQAPVAVPAELPIPAPAASAATWPPSPRPSFRLPERPDDLAVIVGIETYSELPKAAFAERDAAAFREYARALGVPGRNVVLLLGPKAGKSGIEKYVEEWLPRLAKPDSRVYFFFSGHGAPDVRSGQAYLVPWDGDPNFLKTTAYPVKRLYDRLGALPAESVFVAMDSCFSGAGGRSVLASGARPLVTKIETGPVSGRMAVLAAAGADEISGSLDDKGHGAFTFFLLQGLNETGNGPITARALINFITPRVQDEARRLNRDQTPQLFGMGDAVVR